MERKAFCNLKSALYVIVFKGKIYYYQMKRPLSAREATFLERTFMAEGGAHWHKEVAFIK